MSTTLNKIAKTALCLVLCLCICASLCSCAKKTRHLDDVDQICVSGSFIESWMNVFTDEEFITQIVDIYKGVQYEKTDSIMDVSSVGKVLQFTFSDGSEYVAKFIVNEDLDCMFEGDGDTYHITSDFDFDYLKGLVDEQKEKAQKSLEEAE